MPDIEQTIKTILSRDVLVDLSESEMGVEDDLHATFGMTSLGFLELRSQLELEFNVTIDDADFSPESFRSIRTVSDLVRRLVSAAAEAR